MLFILLIVILIVAVVFDVHTRRIPNILTIGGIFAGVILNAAFGGSHGFLQSIYGLAIMTLVGGFFWASRLIGGADHKLLMAAASFAGYSLTIFLMPSVAIVGGLQAIVWIMATRIKGNNQSWRELAKTMRIPYSVSIAIGTIATLLLAKIGAI